jgi:hypothetical protein
MNRLAVTLGWRDRRRTDLFLWLRSKRLRLRFQEVLHHNLKTASFVGSDFLAMSDPYANYVPVPLAQYLKGHRVSPHSLDALRFLSKLGVFITAWSDIERGLQGILEDCQKVPGSGVVFDDLKVFPNNFGKRLELFKECFRDMPVLATAKDDAMAVHKGMTDLSADRNHVIHGIWTPLPDEGQNIFAVSLGRYRKRDMTVAHLRIDEEVLDQMAAKMEVIASYLFAIAKFIRGLAGLHA